MSISKRSLVRKQQPTGPAALSRIQPLSHGAVFAMGYAHYNSVSRRFGTPLSSVGESSIPRLVPSEDLGSMRFVGTATSTASQVDFGLDRFAQDLTLNGRPATWAFRIKVTTASNCGVLQKSDANVSRGWSINLATAGLTPQLTLIGSSVNMVALSSVSLTANAWNTVVCMYDGGTTSASTTWLINGVAATSSGASLSGSHLSDEDYSLFVGSSSMSPSGSLAGDMQSIVMLNRNWSPEEAKRWTTNRWQMWDPGISYPSAGANADIQAAIAMLQDATLVVTADVEVPTFLEPDLEQSVSLVISGTVDLPTRSGSIVMQQDASLVISGVVVDPITATFALSQGERLVVDAVHVIPPNSGVVGYTAGHYQLVLYLSPAKVTVTQPTSGGSYPWLLNVGTLRNKVRAGHLSSLGGGETPSLQLSLDNTRKQVSTLIGRPLRVRADVLSDDLSVFFSGIVSSVTYEPTMTMVLEA